MLIKTGVSQQPCRAVMTHPLRGCLNHQLLWLAANFLSTLGRTVGVAYNLDYYTLM